VQIIGIDPGVSGAVGVLTETGRYVFADDLPTVLANKSSNRRMVSPADLARMLRTILQDAPAECVAITENVASMPEQGVASVFAFGKSYGILLGVLAALGISTHIVSPRKWKGFYALGNDKEQSRELAQRMWPDAPLGLKKYHGRAEALMLARYYSDAIARPLAAKPF
jgi:Holliday junction resolvasome RuvABC endonuclease subunit